MSTNLVTRIITPLLLGVGLCLTDTKAQNASTAAHATDRVDAELPGASSLQISLGQGPAEGRAGCDLVKSCKGFTVMSPRGPRRFEICITYNECEYHEYSDGTLVPIVQ